MQISGYAIAFFFRSQVFDPGGVLPQPVVGVRQHLQKALVFCTPRLRLHVIEDHQGDESGNGQVYPCTNHRGVLDAGFRMEIVVSNYGDSEKEEYPSQPGAAGGQQEGLHIGNHEEQGKEHVLHKQPREQEVLEREVEMHAQQGSVFGQRSSAPDEDVKEEQGELIDGPGRWQRAPDGDHDAKDGEYGQLRADLQEETLIEDRSQTVQAPGTHFLRICKEWQRRRNRCSHTVFRAGVRMGRRACGIAFHTCLAMRRSSVSPFLSWSWTTFRLAATRPGSFSSCRTAPSS